MRLVNPQNAINTPGVITADLKLSLKMQNKIKEKQIFFFLIKLQKERKIRESERKKVKKEKRSIKEKRTK